MAFDRIKHLVEKYDTICIYRHQSPDGDALGSQFGLAKIIEDNYPDKKVYTMGKDFDSIKGLFPNLYPLEGGPDKDALAIILDTANSPRIDDESWRNAGYSIKIDHHPFVEDYAKEEFIMDTAAATCKIILTLAKDVEWNIPHDAAKYLYVGLITDTGRFRYRGVNDKTFEAAISVIKAGVDIIDIYDTLYKRTLKDVRFNSEVSLNFKLENGVGYYFATQETLDKFSMTPDEAKMSVGAMAGIEGVNVWLLAYPKDGEIKASVRSEKVIINKVCENYNGGGHKLACGVKLKNEEELKSLIKDLEVAIKNG